MGTTDLMAKNRRLSAQRTIAVAIGAILAFLLIAFVLWPSTKSVDTNGAPLEEGYIVRHRVDGRIGIVTWSERGQCGVRFSCNYSSPQIYQLVVCESFELILLSENEEENLYWRWNRREAPKDEQPRP